MGSNWKRQKKEHDVKNGMAKLENASQYQLQGRTNEDGFSRLLWELSSSKDKKKMVSNTDYNLGKSKIS